MNDFIQRVSRRLKEEIRRRRRVLTPDEVEWAYRLFLERDPENRDVIAERMGRLPDLRALVEEFFFSDECRARMSRLYRAGTLTHDDVVWAYRLLLGRDPENQDVVRRKLADGNIRALIEGLAAAPEFAHKPRTGAAPTLTGAEPAMNIQISCTDAELEELLRHVQAAWSHMGETDPFWSVLAEERFRGKTPAEIKAAFYESGEAAWKRLAGTLARNGVNLSPAGTVVEYGCGLGRITRWLAPNCGAVLGLDISEPHLREARKWFAESGVKNVEFRHVTTLRNMTELPPADLVYCVIVLQHNPPPLMREMVRGFLKALRPGGTAVFQLPTYRLGYSFALRDYLTEQGGKHEMEMHVLPQSAVFDIAAQEGAQVLEAIEDDWTGYRRMEVSNTFVIRRP